MIFELQVQCWSKTAVHGESRSYPGVIGEPITNDPAGPEEEVFTISLETPPKSTELDRSHDWPLLESSFADDDLNSTFDRTVLVPDTSVHNITRDDLEDQEASASTPGQQRRSTRAPRRDSRVRAPRRSNNRGGRAESLTRYVHKYDCEDLLEYSVDIHDWKMSLEEVYTPEDWQHLQHELTPFMRFSLLDWLVSVARRFEFSLETWCLAVGYLDRFLGLIILIIQASVPRIMYIGW